VVVRSLNGAAEVVCLQSVLCFRKKFLSSMVLADYALILSFYMLLAFTGIFAFREINDLYTLNFQVAGTR
jgi:hypothetical protein